MSLSDNLAALVPILLSAPAAATGDVSMDIVSNLSIVGVAWYFYKKTEQRNEKIENEIRENEKAHKNEIREERQRFEALLKDQQTATAENIEKMVNLQSAADTLAEERYNNLLERLLNAFDRS